MKILRYEHVGIRVSNRKEAVSFYESLGFKEVKDLPEHEANEMMSEDGVYLNLIFNAVEREGRANILYDENQKYPGITHPAFVVDNMQKFLDHCENHNIPISEGPIKIGSRRSAVFLRDPDGNVLEFDAIED